LPSAERRAELEWPEEVCGLLERWSDGENFVDQILNGNDTELAKVGLDDGIVGQRNSLAIDLSITSLVEKFSNRLEVGLSICDIWLDQSQHLRSCLGELDEDTVVDLQQTKELHDLSWLGGNLVYTLDSNDECKFGLSWYVEVTILLGSTLQTDLFTLGLSVFLNIFLCSLEDDFSLLL